MVVLLLVLSIAALLAFDYFIGWSAVGANSAREAQLAGCAPPVDQGSRALDSEYPADDLGDVPAGLFFAPGHIWLQLNPSGTVRLGSGELPLTALGSISSLSTAAAGSTLEAGDTVAVLGSGKRTISLRSPLAGRVLAVNGSLGAEPQRLRSGSVESRWLCEVQPRQLSASIRRMSVGEDASAWMRSELARVREFLSFASAVGGLAPASLPDGGLPVDGLADKMDDRCWSEFAKKFFGNGARRGRSKPEPAA